MSDDTISRKATIEAMENVDWYHINKDGQLVHGANSKDDEPLYKAKDVYAVLNTMSSEQPEPCVDTIDALDESIKHFDDMAEECRRNANIEQNDYMDMRDDAAEYRQLSIWLNELKWLRERFQSQPDSKETSPTHKALDTISRQAAIDAVLDRMNVEKHGRDAKPEEIQWALEKLPPAQPEQRYTKEELRVFAHGISLSLLSKRSAQHWRYDKDTATEIEFLERLYDKVSADMKGGQG